MTDKRTREIANQKLTCRIDIPVTEEMSDRLLVMATLMKKPKAELARELLTVQIEGMYALMESSISWPGVFVHGKD